MSQFFDFSKGLFHFMNDPYALPFGTPRHEDPYLGAKRAKEMGTSYPVVAPSEALSIKGTPRAQEIRTSGYGSMLHLIGFDDLSGFSLDPTNSTAMGAFMNGDALGAASGGEAIDGGTADPSINNDIPSGKLSPNVERLIAPTIAFEGKGYAQVTGNFDGAGLSWGRIQWNLKNGNLQSVWLAMRKANQALFDGEFKGDTAKLNALIAMCEGTAGKYGAPAAISFGDQISVRNSSGKVVGVDKTWQTILEGLGSIKPFQEIQDAFILRDYVSIAANICHDFKLKSERGFALAFDIAVQNGGIGKSARADINAGYASLPDATEQQRMEIVVTAVVRHTVGEWKKDVNARKQAFIQWESKMDRFDLSLNNQWSLA